MGKQQIDSLNREIAALEKELTAVKKQLDAQTNWRETIAADAKKRVDAAKRETVNAHTEITRLKEALAKSNWQSQTLREENASLKEDNDALRKKLAGVEIQKTKSALAYASQTRLFRFKPGTVNIPHDKTVFADPSTGEIFSI